MRQALAVTALMAMVGFGGMQGCASTPSSDAQAKTRYKVVMQVSEDDPKQWNLALNNAENVENLLGKERVELAIVAFGPGMNMLKAESKVAGRVNQALDHNVDIIACGTTMGKMKLTKADLIGGTRVVPGGVVEIADKVRAGWIYIRP